MVVLICPGVHSPELTQSFRAGLGRQHYSDLVFPADRYPAYSVHHIWQFLQAQTEGRKPKDILLIGFSAGVVGAMGTAMLWQGWAGTVKALIALDGWGVPLVGNFPIYRISHDRFTHWSSGWLGGKTEGFYADPAVAHLELWRSPQSAKGWWVAPESQAAPENQLGAEAETTARLGSASPTDAPAIYTTATHVLSHLLQHYDEI